MYNALFWRDTFERVLNTALQALLAVLLVDGTNLANLDYKATAVMVGSASAVALVKALLAATKGDAVSPASLASPPKDL